MYGYRIENGRAVIDPDQQEKLLKLYRLYLAGWSIKICAEETDIPYSVAGRALSNPTYVGTDFYPPIIDADMYAKVQEDREERCKRVPDTTGPRLIAKPIIFKFQMNPLMYQKKPDTDNLCQWLYDQIQSGDEREMDQNTMAAVRHHIA